MSQKNQKKFFSSLPPLNFSTLESLSGAGHSLLSPYSGHSNLFLAGTLLGHPCSPQPNGVIQSAVQEAPLALITKPRGHSRTPDKPLLAATSPAFSTPVNLTTGAREHSLSASSSASASTTAGVLGPATSSPRPRKGKPTKVTMVAAAGPSPGQQSHLVQSLVDLFRGTESDIPSSKDSNDSAEDVEDWDDDDDDDDDDEDEDDDDDEISDDSQSGQPEGLLKFDHPLYLSPVRFFTWFEIPFDNVED